MRICDPFREAGWWFRVGDYNFELQCTCGVTQRADALRSSERDGVTLYACTHCGTNLIGVAADDRPPVKGAAAAMPQPSDDGHRMCGFVFGSKVDMAMWPAAANESFMDIPARPRFFSRRGCE